ncbi:uncharacterized protein LOC133904735 [Phragmites australis]|uniref:uncharacterized protein LOC133904735 n=1 Tax=Phragmites australis TaxID=29695 RepID=UPI002D79D6C4|nr:uncharacterized protein LOC133904735 [Phragmites australis]
MASILSKVSSVVAACARRVMRATRRLLRPRPLRRSGSLCLGRQLVPADGGSNGTGAGDTEEDGQGLWRRAILMGERCEPLDFPGAIHYDSLGRRLQAPRSGSGKEAAAALFCRSSDAVDEAVTTTKKARYA